MQYFPGTNAGKYRAQFQKELKNGVSYLKDELIPAVRTRKSYIYSVDKANFRSINYPLIPAELFLAGDEILMGFDRFGIIRNSKEKLKEISGGFPLIKNLIAKKFSRVMHDILNPFRLVDDLLIFFHRLFNRILEIGTQKGEDSSWPRLILKRLVGVFFGIVKAPIKIAKYTVDMLFEVAKFILTPVFHLGSSLKNLIKNWDQKLILTDAKTLLTARYLRFHAKHNIPLNESPPPGSKLNCKLKIKSLKTYSVNKEDLYIKEKIEKESYILVSFSTKQKNSNKIKQYPKLLARANACFFRKPPQITEEDINYVRTLGWK